MTVTVNLHSEDQEKALFDFLDKMNFEYQSDVRTCAYLKIRKKKSSDGIIILLAVKPTRGIGMILSAI